MIIDKSEIDGVTILGVQGYIGEVEAYTLEKEFMELFAQSRYRLVLDMEKVDFMTSAGLGVLMMCMKQTKRNDGFVRIAKPQPLISQILHATKLDSYFEIYPSLQAALEGLAGRDSPEQTPPAPGG